MSILPSREHFRFSVGAPRFVRAWAAWFVASVAVLAPAALRHGDPAGSVFWNEASALLFPLLAIPILRAWLEEIEPSLTGRPRLRGFVMAVCVLLVAGIHAAIRHAVFPWDALRWSAGLLGTAALLTFAMALGGAMSHVLKRPSELVPLGVVMGLTDVASLSSGPTRSVSTEVAAYYGGGMSGPPPWVDALLVKTAIPGRAILMPLFGVSDWIIVAFLTAVSVRFGLDDGVPSPGRSAFFRKIPPIPAAAAGLLAALVLARNLGWFLPALPVVALVYLAVVGIRHRAVFHLTPADRRLTLGAAAAVAGVFAAWNLIR